MARVVGGPAVGTSFFDRDLIVERLIERLNYGSILLVAPRRFGKTSIMLRVKEILDKDEKSLNLYLDIEWVTKPSDLIVEIICKTKESMGEDFSKCIRSLPKRLIKSVKGHIDTVEILGFKLDLKKELQDDWMEKGRDLFKAIKESSSQIVLFLDEFPLMVQNMLNNKSLSNEEVRSFLYWLRSMRNELNLRMVLGGSIGIDHILQSLRASAAINDLERILVGPFDFETAKEFIGTLLSFEGIEINEKSLQKMLEIIGEPIPYFLQIFVAAILNEVKAKSIPISENLVEEIYRRRVLGIDCRTYFEHYFQRLSIYYEPEEVEIIKNLLQELANNESMHEREFYAVYSSVAKKANIEQFKHLIDALENDFYLIFDSEKKVFRFATRILRDLWLLRFGVFT